MHSLGFGLADFLCGLGAAILAMQHLVADLVYQRKLAQYEGGKRVPVTMCAVSDPIRWAEEILKTIDERWLVK